MSSFPAANPIGCIKIYLYHHIRKTSTKIAVEATIHSRHGEAGRYAAVFDFRD
jgi:hypothetical protein